MVTPSRSDVIAHWLLNSAVLRPVRLGELFPLVRGQSLNVKEIPGCRPRDYAEGLLGLFNRDLIKLQSHIPGDEVGGTQGVEKILERFLGLSGNDPTYRLEVYEQIHLGLPAMKVSFELTHPGGQAWERLAEPQWARFVSGWTTSDGLGELFSPDIDLLIAYMGWYPEVNCERIRLQTLEWHAQQDFEVLYWKHLPLVYRATFTVDPADSCWGPVEPRWFQDWHSSIMRWYTNPWDLPSWPLK
jgi:hypothetical protein